MHFISQAQSSGSRWLIQLWRTPFDRLFDAFFQFSSFFFNGLEHIQGLAGTRQDYNRFAIELASQGYAAASIDYRLSEEAASRRQTGH